MLARSIVTGLSAALLLSAPARSEDFADAALDLCEKVKGCAVEQMNQQEITPEVRQMMEPMLEGMCANMQGKVEDVPSGHPLYQPALQCMRSMADLSCEAMQDPAGAMTPQCQEYEEMLREQYPEGLGQ